MIILNFYPLTPAHLQAIEALTGQAVEQVIDRPAQFDPTQSFIPPGRGAGQQHGLVAGGVARIALTEGFKQGIL